MEPQPSLPAMPVAVAPSPRQPAPTRPEHARVVRPERTQVEWAPRSLDDSLAVDHPARAIWGLLERLDLAALYAPIRALLDRPGRPASDPQVLLGLWILATVDGIGSARELARRCETDDAYRWRAGGVPVNYHLLADFRVAHQQALDDLLTDLIGLLLHQGLVTLERVAQDGVRVRASAGASSFRRRATLERCRAEAQAQVEQLAAEREQPAAQGSRRQQAARERAVRERQARVEAALAELPAVAAIKAKQRQQLAKGKRERVAEARVSTSDPQARVMKQADGGFRPSYNVQVVTDQASRAILAVAVSTQGSDGGLAPPLEAQVAERSGQHPGEYLIDGGLTTRETITTLDDLGVTVYGPVEPPRTATSGRTAFDPRPDDSPAVVAWRARMGSEAGQAVYRLRGALAEWTNAQWRTRHGLRQFTVRGLTKVTSVMLLLAVTHNLLRALALGG